MSKHTKSLAWKLHQISGAAINRTNELISQGDARGAKAHLADCQRAVREVKQAITEAKRQIREQATDARLTASAQGQITGQLFGANVRRHNATRRAARKRSISRSTADALAEYTPLEAHAARILLTIDNLKARVNEFQRTSNPRNTHTTPAPHIPPPPPTSTPTPPPSWLRDPSGRHQHRWWDGNQWTEHVSTNGQTSTDHMEEYEKRRRP